MIRFDGGSSGGFPTEVSIRHGVVTLRRQPDRWSDVSDWRAVNAGRSDYRDHAVHDTRLSTSSVTTAGSASVEVSPRLSVSFAAILRRMRRMILPLRVFGSAGAHWIASGEAIGPISLRTQATSSLRNSSLGSSPSFKVT